MSATFALVPVKDPALGKSRLSPVLDPAGRRALNATLARHTVATCARVLGAERTLVIGRTDAVAGIAAAAGARLVPEPPGGQGLNAALEAGARIASAAGAVALLVVPTDLVNLNDAVLRAALEALPPAPGCVLVPDRHGIGTNLLVVSPALTGLFGFGEASLARHSARARALGLTLRRHDCAALALDLDLPADYALWQSARVAA